MEGCGEKNGILGVRVRGTASDNPDVQRTMESLKLERTFQARLLDNTPSNLGMLRSAKVLVAWGEVSPDLLGRVFEKRGERDGADGLDDGFLRLLGKSSFDDLAKSVVAGETSLHELLRAGLKVPFRFHPPLGWFKRSLRRAATYGGGRGDPGPGSEHTA